MKRRTAGFVALVLLVCCVTAALAEQVAAEAIDENDRLIVLNTAKIMGYTDEQLAQVTVQEKRTDQDDLRRCAPARFRFCLTKEMFLSIER